MQSAAEWEEDEKKKVERESSVAALLQASRQVWTVLPLLVLTLLTVACRDEEWRAESVRTGDRGVVVSCIVTLWHRGSVDTAAVWNTQQRIKLDVPQVDRGGLWAAARRGNPQVLKENKSYISLQSFQNPICHGARTSATLKLHISFKCSFWSNICMPSSVVLILLLYQWNRNLLSQWNNIFKQRCISL